MKVVMIVVAGGLLAVLVWLCWLTGKPVVIPPIPADEAQRLEALVPDGAREGNRLTVYTGLAGMFDTMVADIESARHHVHLEFFKFEDDDAGRRVGDAMAGVAARGGEARLLYDDLLCCRWRGLYRSMEVRGVQTLGYGPVRWPLPRKADYYRNHRKLVVVDGRVAYLGGFNIADRYLKGLDWGCWRDTMVRIEGPAVLALQRVFAADWRYAGGRLLDGERYFPPVTPAGTTPVRVIASGPIGEGPSIMHFTTTLQDRAERYAWFESPYFIPPDEVRQAMLRAARRGVDVRVLLPPRGDRGETTQWASKSYLAEMMAAGVGFGLYRPGYLHSKMVVCDDRVGMVGSCNIDPRSYLLCQEVAAVVEDAGFASGLRAVFLADEAQSLRIDPADWARRPLGQKANERLSRLVASYL